MIVASYDNEASAVAAQPRIHEVLGKMAEFMTSPPEVKEGSAIWTMQKFKQLMKSLAKAGLL